MLEATNNEVKIVFILSKIITLIGRLTDEFCVRIIEFGAESIKIDKADY